MIIFTLKTLEVKGDPYKKSAWSDMFQKLPGLMASPFVSGKSVPDAVLLIRNTKDLVELAKAITAAEDAGLKYQVEFVKETLELPNA